MSIDLTSIATVVASDVPPKLGLFGTGGVGKTTLASEFPDPVFVPTEAGMIGIDGVAAFPLLTSYEEVMEALRSLAGGGHSFRTVVVDTLSRFETMVYAATCDRCNWKSIEDPGYGKGYVEAMVEWSAFLKGINHLRDKCRILPVLIAHDEVRTHNDPMTRDYDRVQMRLHRKAEALIKEDLDILGYMTQEVVVATEDTKGKERAKKGKAMGAGQRLLKLAPRPSFTAKCRYRDIPAEVPIDLGTGWSTLASAVPAIAAHAQGAVPVTDAA